MGNAAEMLRRLQQGESPSRIVVIRPEIISGAETRVTTLEAAVYSRKVQNVRLLDDRGAIVGADTRQALACLAQDLEATDIVEYLSPGSAPACEPGAARVRIRSRRRGAE